MTEHRHEKEDLAFLNVASDKGVFNIEIGSGLEIGMSNAFDRGVDEEWFTLIDVRPIGSEKSFRVFRLTKRGLARRTALRRTARNSLESQL